MQEDVISFISWNQYILTGDGGDLLLIPGGNLEQKNRTPKRHLLLLRVQHA